MGVDRFWLYNTTTSFRFYGNHKFGLFLLGLQDTSMALRHCSNYPRRLCDWTHPTIVWQCLINAHLLLIYQSFPLYIPKKKSMEQFAHHWRIISIGTCNEYSILPHFLFIHPHEKTKHPYKSIFSRWCSHIFPQLSQDCPRFSIVFPYKTDLFLWFSHDQRPFRLSLGSPEATTSRWPSAQRPGSWSWTSWSRWSSTNSSASLDLESWMISLTFDVIRIVETRSSSWRNGIKSQQNLEHGWVMTFHILGMS